MLTPQCTLIQSDLKQFYIAMLSTCANTEWLACMSGVDSWDCRMYLATLKQNNN